MAAVDPDDDGIWRFVLRRYAYDPERHERRHQVVAAFDDEQEFHRLLDTLGAELRRRKAAGEPVDPQEHYTGMTLEPGHRRRAADGHLLRKAMSHGAVSDELLDRLDLPSNMGVIRARLVGPGEQP